MILKNGKRIDGCTDTLPVGTVQPFLGLTPPLGYLVCQGQLISKVEYPELYNICKSTFGTETDTHFYLPDLRGKTLAGYDTNNAAMNTIGKLVGQAEHTHAIPSHSHTYSLRYSSYWDAFVQFADDQGADTLLAAKQKDGSYKKAFAYTPTKMDTHMNLGVEANRTDVSTTAHFQVDGDTSEVNTTASTTSNYQPTVTVNWIVKAVMLIPHYFTVENTLTSTNTSNALSAAQGKILNDGKFNISGGVISGQTRVEVPGVTGATEVPIWSNAQLLVGSTVTNGAITRCPSIGFVEYQNADGVLYMKDRALFWASSNNNMGHIPAANTGYEIVHTGNKYDVIGINWTNNKEVRTLDSIDGKPIYKKYVEGNFNGTSNVTLATGVDKYLDAQITVLRESATQWHRANAHVMPHVGGDSVPEHIDCIFQQNDKIRTYCTNPTFTTAAFRGFIYYTKL